MLSLKGVPSLVKIQNTFGTKVPQSTFENTLRTVRTNEGTDEGTKVFILTLLWTKNIDILAAVNTHGCWYGSVEHFDHDGRIFEGCSYPDTPVFEGSILLQSWSFRSDVQFKLTVLIFQESLRHILAFHDRLKQTLNYIVLLVWSSFYLRCSRDVTSYNCFCNGGIKSSSQNDFSSFTIVCGNTQKWRYAYLFC